MLLLRGDGVQCSCPDCRWNSAASPERLSDVIETAAIAIRPKPRSRKPHIRPKQKQIKTLRPIPADILLPSYKNPVANTFPVPRSSEITSALQYFAEVFAYSIHPHYEDAPKAWHGSLFYKGIMQSAMADPMWFCATVAFNEAMLNCTVHDSIKKTDVVIKYQSKAFMDLRRRLANEQDSNVLLLTITTLMSIDITYGTLESLRMHMEGLDRVLEVRGGLETLNDEPYLKHKIIGYKHFWLLKQMAHATAATTVEYPEHPFSSDLCVAVAKLPRDLSELALTGALNVALIRLAADVAAMHTKIQCQEQKQPEDLRRLKILAYELDELFKTSGMSELERLICGALIDYATSLDTDRSSHWLLVCTARMHLSGIWRNGVKWDSRHSRIIVWVGTMLATCSEVGSLTWRLGTDILNTCSKHVTLSKVFMVDTCTGLIWDKDLTIKLEQKFDFDTTPSPRPVSVPSTFLSGPVNSASTGTKSESLGSTAPTSPMSAKSSTKGSAIDGEAG